MGLRLHPLLVLLLASGLALSLLELPGVLGAGGRWPLVSWWPGQALIGLHAVSAVLCLALLPGPVRADADSERETLTRLAHELATLEPLIREAEAQTNHDTRIRFQYNWLRQDLARIRMGIQEHINAPRAEPRKVEPLRGDYRR